MNQTAPRPAFLFPIWLLIILIQIGFLFFFYRSFLYDIGGERYWAVSDDIYITADYARCLTQGRGLVWFPGAPRVEGITNPFWAFIFAGLQALPFFHVRLLGAFVLALNAILLIGVFLLFRKSAERVLWNSAGARPPGSPAWALALLALTTVSLPYWLAEGFEVGLIALLALLGFAIAASGRRSAWAMVSIGLLAGLAFWTRMDGVLYFGAAFFLILFSRSPRLRPLIVLSLTTLAMMATLFLARKDYYGEWLPNTYYLKLHGWPLSERLVAGLRQNWPILPSLIFAWGALAVPTVQRRLLPVLPAILALLLTFTITVLYSTSNGGDAWGLKAGYDRFTVTGSLLFQLALALAVALLLPDERIAKKGVLFAWGLLLLPIVLSQGFFPFLYNSLTLREPRLERAWIQRGLQYRTISNPGALIAVRPAGAIVYFSERGGVDLLGKSDPQIARQPVTRPDMPPGHNKWNLPLAFEIHRPDLARIEPPENVRDDYQAKVYGGKAYWVRTGSPYVRWDQLDDPAPFTYGGGWDTRRNPRFLKDVNGDRKADIVGFGDGGVVVSLSTGHGFGQAESWLKAFGIEQGWDLETSPRVIADFNGDGRMDVGGFDVDGVRVALSDAARFRGPDLWVKGFGRDHGWTSDRHLRRTADVNGDGKADILGFGDAGILVALSSGAGFSEPAFWTKGFGTDNGWGRDRHPRYLADINGDTMADVVGFGDAGVIVSLSTGDTFTSPSLWLDDFGLRKGWQAVEHPRFTGDVNGDGRDDLIGFGNQGVLVALSTGRGFENPTKWSDEFGRREGWDPEGHPRILADANGDGMLDIVAFSRTEARAAYSTGKGFLPSRILSDGMSLAQGWQVGKHLRLMGDIRGDRVDRLVGFGVTSLVVPDFSGN
ncbi:VCBS repeat-containing protein [bacterium]|nr:VCBS repeat-containing protein [bacterium]